MRPSVINGVNLAVLHPGWPRHREKQGIWMLIFPDKENTGNLVKIIFFT